LQHQGKNLLSQGGKVSSLAFVKKGNLNAIRTNVPVLQGHGFGLSTLAM
jgi:hypothetical protein